MFAIIWFPKVSCDNVGTGVTSLEVKATSKSYFDVLSLFSLSCVIRVLVCSCSVCREFLNSYNRKKEIWAHQ